MKFSHLNTTIASNRELLMYLYHASRVSVYEYLRYNISYLSDS